jgi:hypothetical protein
MKIILLVAVAIAGLSLGSGVGAGSGSKSPAATPAVHVRDLVVQGRSTDRARMPAKVQRLLKRATDSPAFNCPGATTATKVNTAAAQTCIWPSNYAGQVICIQVSNSATVTQTCDSTQTNTTTNNNALMIQIIWAQHQSSPQDGTQIVKLRQTNGTGTNHAGVSQYIKQSLGRGTPDDTEDGENEPDAAATILATQSQESHQTIHLRQITGNLLAPTAAAGSNNAALLQFLRQRERASHAATAQQSQNIDDRPACVPDATSDETSLVMQNDANQCIISNQTSTTGKQNLLLNGDYNQFQRVRGASAGFQDQGVDSQGGGDYGLVQLSTGLSNVLTNQNERLVQRAINATAVFQDQNGPRKSQGSSQGTNTADKWRGFQTSTLIQTSTGSPSFQAAMASPGHQSDVLEYFGFSSGDIRATQTANMNGDQTNWGCPEPGTTQTGNNNSCAAVVHCDQGSVDSLRWSQVGDACTPACPEGTVFNSETGQCESIFTSTLTFRRGH